MNRCIAPRPLEAVCGLPRFNILAAWSLQYGTFTFLQRYDRGNNEFRICTLYSRIFCHSVQLVSPQALELHGTIRPSDFKAHPQSSCRLPLDVLPVELQFFILELLDFRSLSRLARSCHRAMAVVQSFPAYRSVMEHGSMALLALSRMDLLSVHSAATLYKALRSMDCSCLQSICTLPFSAYL